MCMRYDFGPECVNNIRSAWFANKRIMDNKQYGNIKHHNPATKLMSRLFFSSSHFFQGIPGHRLVWYCMNAKLNEYASGCDDSEIRVTFPLIMSGRNGAGPKSILTFDIHADDAPSIFHSMNSRPQCPMHLGHFFEFGCVLRQCRRTSAP